MMEKYLKNLNILHNDSRYLYYVINIKLKKFRSSV
jgi:hypothetical protein